MQKSLPMPRTVSVAELRPNDWNPNSMSDFMVGKARASLRQFGFVDPVLARTVPGVPGLEIVDGEQRWRASILEGLSTIAVIDLGEISDAKAKSLTVVLNETRGRFDRNGLAVLIGGLLNSGDDALDAAAREVLPYTDRELDSFVKAAAFDWGSLDRENPADSTDPRDGADFKASKTFKVKVTSAEERTIRRAMALAIDRRAAGTEGEALALFATLAPEVTP